MTTKVVNAYAVDVVGAWRSGLADALQEVGDHVTLALHVDGAPAAQLVAAHGQDLVHLLRDLRTTTTAAQRAASHTARSATRERKQRANFAIPQRSRGATSASLTVALGATLQY